ncbi:MAG: N-acetylmuramoyl-L-alanine amidase [Caldilineae bacterium]|nr:MAG: N-acetylmuramoyl-L-alanine amidase [Caldilineae bacterium]
MKWILDIIIRLIATLATAVRVQAEREITHSELSDRGDMPEEEALVAAVNDTIASRQSEERTAQVAPSLVHDSEQDEEHPTLIKPDLLIVIDPGHGPATRGKRSPRLPDGRRFLEYEYNYAVGDLVTHALLTRHTDNVINTVHEWRRQRPDTPMGNDLRFRVAVANDACRRHRSVYGDDGEAIFISIHANAAPQPHPEAWVPSVRGVETWYYRGSEEGRLLAMTVHPYLAAVAIEHMHSRDRGIKYHREGQRPFYVLAHTIMPSVLLETGFYTHPEEVLLLMDDEVRQLMAAAIVNGIIDYARKKGKTYEQHA